MQNGVVQNRLYFKEPGDNSDPYYLEKVNTKNNESHLRMTINDDADESFQIWGNSCGEQGGCGGPGAMKHTFDAQGNAVHRGQLTVNKPAGYKGAINVGAPASPESLYSIHFGDGSDVEGRQAGMGYIANQPNAIHPARGTLATHIHKDDAVALYSSGWNPLMSIKGDTGAAYIKGPLKVRHPHGGWTDNASITTQATNGQIGASFAGQDGWSHFPWIDQNTYIRPGKDNHGINVGDWGAAWVNVGRGNTATTVKGTLSVDGGNNDKWNWVRVFRNDGDHLYFGGDNTNRGIWSHGDRPFSIYTGGQNRVSVDKDGRVDVRGPFCIDNVCIRGEDLQKMVKHGDTITVRSAQSGRRMQGADGGVGVARFENSNRGGWEKVQVEKCGINGIGDNKPCA